MRVLLAGASGAVGTPLTRQLIAAGHEVVGISRSQANAERLRNTGAEAVVADVMDREGLLAAVRGVRADAVMHQLTALGTTKMRDAMRGTNALRTTGTAHLLAAARTVGAHRFLTQSIVFGYGYRDHGARVITEDDPVRWADYLDALAAELGARRPWRVPTWMLRPIPYLHAIMTTSMRVSNAKARRELGWAPAVPTYREGIPLVAKAIG